MSGTSNTKMPKGIPYIIGNEAAERYSFYGMKAILFIFMTQFLVNSAGESAVLDEPMAKFWFHMFAVATYFTPILGSFISDIFWGKYRTIIRLSILYIIGHLTLALFETPTGLVIGCALIALGAGGIKPCVSAHVGDQFREDNKELFEKIYLYFYLAINAGAVFAYIFAEPILRNEYLISKGINASVAFGIPGLLMILATFLFWKGKKEFIAIKPAGWALYKKELFSAKGFKTIKRLIPLYLFLAVFWSLFDQTGAAWVEQASNPLMNKTINLGFVSFDFLPSQIGFFNPLLVVLFIPLFSMVIYPAMRKRMTLGYMKKISIGFFIAVLSFAVISYAQQRMDGGVETGISWQIFAYVLLTAAEIMVSITALEFSYTQAPNALKSFIMSFYLLSVMLGNLFTAMVNLFIINPDGSVMLEGASYFWFFTGLMLAASVVFVIYSQFYQEQTFIQPEEDIETV